VAHSLASALNVWGRHLQLVTLPSVYASTLSGAITTCVCTLTGSVTYAQLYTNTERRQQPFTELLPTPHAADEDIPPCPRDLWGCDERETIIPEIVRCLEGGSGRLLSKCMRSWWLLGPGCGTVGRRASVMCKAHCSAAQAGTEGSQHTLILSCSEAHPGVPLG
jgi:hypothetical protein